MKCSNCGKNNTNFVYTEIINGVKKEIRLCNECAERLGFLDMSLNMPSLDFSNFFEDFLNEYDDLALMPSIFTQKTNTLKCNKCGTEYDDFLQGQKQIRILVQRRRQTAGRLLRGQGQCKNTGCC